MRPLTLTMQAFGPYAGTEQIEFTRLGNRTMFVISGKTGSGKTTIFDGISYAIYGKASGEDRSGSDLRSQFAKDDVLTEVSLEFTLRNKTYFIHRSPQQEKKKARGHGFTTVTAKAELYVYDENGEKQLLAANVRDVDEKIKEIMIIDSNQFRQIVMIPQGEFRKLLTSESKEKEVILQRLFHTQVYKRVEETLKEDAAELKGTVEKQIEQRSHALAQIHALFHEELIALKDAGSANDSVIMPLLQTEIELMEKELEKLTEQLHEKKTYRDRVQQKLYEAEALAKQLNTKEELRQQKEKLEANKEQFITMEKQIQLARQAALLDQQEELCHRLKKDLDAANQDLASLRPKIASLSERVKEQEQMWIHEKNREDERKAAGEEISRLQNMKEDIESFALVQEETAKLEMKLKRKHADKKQLEDSVIRIEQLIQKLTDEKQAIDKEQLAFMENTHRLEKIAEEIAYLDKYEQQSARYNEALISYEQKKGYLENASTRLHDAKKLLRDIEQKWLHGQASLLASKLQAGKPCPVCGSDHHPLPSASAETVPSEEDLKAAKLQAEELEREEEKAKLACYEAQSAADSLQQLLAELAHSIQKQQPDWSPEDLSIFKQSLMAKQQELIKVQAELKNRQNRHAGCIKELEKCAQQKEAISSQLQKIADVISETAILFTEKNTHLTRMVAAIPEDLRSLAAFEGRLEQAVKKHEDLLSRLETARQMYQDTKASYETETAKCKMLEEQAAKKQAELSLERETFVRNMKARGFETYREYHDAKRSEQELRLLEKTLRDYHEEVRSVSDRYEELSQALKDVKKPNLDELYANLKEIEGQIGLLQDKYTNLAMKKRDNAETIVKVTAINEELKAVEERYKVIGHLYEIAKGQNTYRITFERFVLASFLDDILREANVRLVRMTGGRYELLRKTDRSKGNAQSGLELLVFDQYTGQERHVKTLSGGESFKAALALALGLADIVQQYAGGVSIETMFIDEGFGTLDPESLDQAIEALIDIQSSGRLVGIISHVPELKERIDARLEVTAAQSGSRTEFHFIN